LAPIAPQPFLDHFAGPPGYELVVSASNRSAQLSVIHSQLGVVASTELPLPTPWLSTGVTTLAAEWNDSTTSDQFQLVVQGEALLYKLTVNTSGGVTVTNRYSQRFSAPYVAAFSAFDHLTASTAPGCSTPELWGSGLFPPSAHVTKRGLQQILLDEVDYTWADVDVSTDVTTFAVVARSQRGDVLLAVVGSRAGKEWLEV
jgi:hypothetical protein